MPVPRVDTSDYVMCIMISCLVVPLTPMMQPLLWCTDSESSSVSEISIEPAGANSLPTCLLCPVTSYLCRMRLCPCFAPFNIDQVMLAFVAGGDTCFIKCYPYCFPTNPPLNLNFGGGYYNENQHRPLHYAVSELYPFRSGIYLFQKFPWLKKRTVDYLLAHGADPTLTNHEGKSPFEVMDRKYVSDDAYEKLKAAQVIVDGRREIAREKAKIKADEAKAKADEIAEKKRIAEQQAEERKKEQERLRKEEYDKRVAASEKDIKVIEEFLKDDCQLPADKSRLYAVPLVVDFDCPTVDKLRLLFVRGTLTNAFNSLKVTMQEQEKISQGLFAAQAAPKKKSQVMPMMDGPAGEPEPIVLTDCFLTHDWGVDEKERSNHARVAKVNQYLKNKGLVTWFDEDRMDGNVRRKMTEGIDNTLCMVVFITDRYRNKVNGTEDRDNCRYEFTYGVEQKGPQRMVPVVMEERMVNSREWRQELGAALATKLYVNMVSDEEAEFEARCEELYGRIRSVIGQSRKERGET